MVPYAPTHHSHSASSLLDLCIIDDADKLVNYEERDVSFLSAHDLIGITYNSRVERVPRRLVRVCDFCTFSEEDFFEDLEAVDWNELYQTADVNDKVQIFNEALLKCYNKHAPYRTIHPRYLPAPWLTSDIKALMKDRDRARRI